ncbi:signal peptidase I [Nonomuraea roseoviolacea]|uniref:Signal peptidase I n=1 Tax=Nonomuraea roseoviolacea subsp. carminata TaxID=160689 RepID=A0ABT1JY98_9ACTN|nr:signal peptidase I [Nonomuraea roseoviolacea]MCP2346727.1 signal peptidase I [Nonomuraea roseoviolacea subsp. carminata]
MISKRLSALSLALLLTPVAGCASGLSDGSHYRMSSESMEPTLKKGARLAARPTDDGYVPRVGDIIVFRQPEGWSQGTSEEQISRVIGVPGSTVRCCDGQRRLLLDGKALDEPYLGESPASSLDFERRIPPGRLWVMSDNRDVARDSRSHRDAPDGGTVGVQDVVAVITAPGGS